MTEQATPDRPIAPAALAASVGPPRLPKAIEITDTKAFQDEYNWRVHMARHAASQTLSLQRSEYYARQVRNYVGIWFWFTVMGAVVGLILMGILVAHAGDAASAVN